MTAFPERFVALDCPRCSTSIEPSATQVHCPVCGALTEPRLDLDSVSISPSELGERADTSMWRYEELLPLDAADAVSLGEGMTPLVSCPSLAASLGVSDLYLKAEGANPTGTFKDRGQSTAIAAARLAGVRSVALASAGNAGHAAAAYGARAGLDVHVFLPARSGFTQKAMVNVHGADLTVVQGSLPDAGRAFTDAIAEHDSWLSVATDDTPFRREGKKTMLFELAEQLDWSAPDAIVYPTGGGVGLLGMAKAARELRRLGWIDAIPRLFAAQSSGCDPIVRAFDAGRDDIDRIDHPDTICGGIEVPDPTAAPEILDAIRSTNGGAVATDDDAILDAAIELAEVEGLGIAPTAGATLSGLRRLIDEGHLGEDDRIVLLATGSGLKEADVLRSQLMSKGV